MSVVDEIKSRVEIAEVVSDYITLQKSGRNFKALCPFHSEKTPSFIVNPERQSWHCFGACATGGDALSFVMRQERLDFGEALRLLAQRTGVSLEQRGEPDRNEALRKLNTEAAKYYQEVLASPEGRDASGYLEQRGVDEKTRDSFQLGLSPKGSDALKGRLKSLGFDLEHAVQAGLLSRGQDGSLRGFFWGRLMFPIHDRQGRVTGFGGRSLDGSDPKYINTPATAIFDKRATVYGLHMAAAAIREQESVVIVEGYMDTLAAHQHSYRNVVASMGTALTEPQISQLKNIASRFVLALDPDAAGQEATFRSLESSWHVFERQPLGRRQPPDLKIAMLPLGRDPNDVIRGDAKEWERLVDGALPFMEFLIPAIASRHDLSTGHGKAQAAEAVLPLITTTANAFDQERYFGMLAEALRVTRESLEASIGAVRTVRSRSAVPYGRRSAPSASESALAPDRRDFIEDYVLALLLRRPELRDHVTGLPPEQFHRTENREVFTSWLGRTTIDELRDSLDEALQEQLNNLLRIDLAPADQRSREIALGQSLRRLEKRHLQELQEGLLASGDPSLPPPKELEEEIVRVNARLREIFSEAS